jgi:8-oxo-dGTP pyrophosphatase MutT (NUDIX family)
MAQVYAVVYSKAAGRCLVFRKKEYGYFFDSKYEQPKEKLNGAGLYCFPGGGLELHGRTLAEACREFEEETGLDLSKVRTDRISLFHETDGSYHAVLFDVGPAFNDIFVQCTNNLTKKETTLGETPTKASVETYIANAKKEKLPYIQDDELELVKQVKLVVIGNDVKGDDAETYFTKGNLKTGWFYKIVQQNPAVFPKTK